MTPRRRFRFGLRALLIALTLLCVWFGYYANQARHQRLAAQRVLELGGSVKYDYEYDYDPNNGVNLRTNPRSPYPDWLSNNLLGRDFFHQLHIVSLRETKVADDDLAIICAARNMKSLDLSMTGITSAGLAQLQGLNLRQLSLWKTQVDDDGGSG